MKKKILQTFTGVWTLWIQGGLLEITLILGI